LVKGGCALKHPGHISHIANIPIANVLVKRGCVIKCVDDIRISNGSINAGSFTKISDTQYTIVVTPSLGGQHSNVAITGQ
jgi:hypothetical protein